MAVLKVELIAKSRRRANPSLRRSSLELGTVVASKGPKNRDVDLPLQMQVESRNHRVPLEGLSQRVCPILADVVPCTADVN